MVVYYVWFRALTVARFIALLMLGGLELLFVGLRAKDLLAGLILSVVGLTALARLWLAVSSGMFGM